MTVCAMNFVVESKQTDIKVGTTVENDFLFVSFTVIVSYKTVTKTDDNIFRATEFIK